MTLIGVLQAVGFTALFISIGVVIALVARNSQREWIQNANSIDAPEDQVPVPADFHEGRQLTYMGPAEGQKPWIKTGLEDDVFLKSKKPEFLFDLNHFDPRSPFYDD